MKTITAPNPIKVITSGNVPSLTELPNKGDLAFGKVLGENKIYTNIESEIIVSNSDSTIPHNTLSSRDSETAHEEATDAKSGFMSKEDKARQKLLIEDVELIPEDIVPTNEPWASIITMCTSINGVTYFGGAGIYKLDNDTGNITFIVTPVGYCRNIAISANGTMYFLADNGIFKLDNDTGDIVPTNMAIGDFYYMVTPANGITYFTSRSWGNQGIYKLDNDTGDIVPTNITTRYVYAANVTVDGVAYFSLGNDGIFKVDNDTGDIVPTNITTGLFDVIDTTDSGVTYVSSSSNNSVGTFKVDNNTGDLVPTNITQLWIYTFNTSADGTTYVGRSGNYGIWKLDNDTGDLVPTNITSGFYSVIYTFPDGVTYFGGHPSNSNDLLKLDNDTGDIVPTNFTNRGIWKMGTVGDTVYIIPNMLGIYKYTLPRSYVRQSNGTWCKLPDIPKEFKHEILTKDEYDAKTLKDIIYFVTQP